MAAPILFPFRVIHSWCAHGSLRRQFRPDLVHTTRRSSFRRIVARLLGIPHVWHVREVFSEFAGFCGSISGSFAFLTGSYAFPRPQPWQFHPYIRKRKVQILNNGYPVSEFAPVAPDRVAAFRTRFGLNGARLVVLWPDPFLGGKGQDTFWKPRRCFIRSFQS